MMNRFGVLNLFIAIGLIATVTAIDCKTHPDFGILKECCPHGSLLTKEIEEQCKSFKTATDATHPPDKCYAECGVNATGMVNLATMEVNEAKMKTYLTPMFDSKPDFLQIISDSMITCAAKGKEMRAKFANNPHPTPEAGGCKPCAAMLMGCVKKETLIHCPSSVWKNDEACNNAREFFMECKPKGPHH